jgi:hypothetical protein
MTAGVVGFVDGVSVGVQLRREKRALVLMARGDQQRVLPRLVAVHLQRIGGHEWSRP